MTFECMHACRQHSSTTVGSMQEMDGGCYTVWQGLKWGVQQHKEQATAKLLYCEPTELMTLSADVGSVSYYWKVSF